jgi:hypothetical protein
MIRTREYVYLLAAAASLMCQPQAASAEPRHYAEGYAIDYEVWLEDARIDPTRYFVYPPSNLARLNKCSNQVEADPVEEFFHHFNSLVEIGVLDLLDVKIVWAMRECLNNPDMQEVLNVSRNTYFERLKKIRRVMQNSYQ